jgi:hypothetical protein
VKPDGTLELDEKVPLPAGRVLVTVQPVVQPPPDDPFWQMMERIWADQRARGHVPRSVEEVEAARRGLREDSEEEIQQAIRLHQACQQQHQQDAQG